MNGVAEDYPLLGRLCDHRDECLQEVMEFHGVSREEAKNLFIRLMMGGTYENWRQEVARQRQNEIMEFARNLEINELLTIRAVVYTANPHMVAAVLAVDPHKWKSKDAEKRGVMALWSQTIERVIQETAISFLVETKHIPLQSIIPCQDGFMVPVEHHYAGMVADCDVA